MLFIIKYGMSNDDLKADGIHAGIIRKRSEGVPAVMWRMLETELIHDRIPVFVLVCFVCVIVSVFVIGQVFLIRIVPAADQR